MAHPSSTSERQRVPREARTRRVTPAQVRSYLGKAEEFLVAARQSLDAGYTLAATSLAVHSGISAGDAICGARTGQRAAGSDHGQAVALLAKAGREGKDASASAHPAHAAEEPRSTSRSTSRRLPRLARSIRPNGSCRSRV